MMSFANYRRLVSVFVYCGVAVLLIVNGQSTTDDDTDKDEINRLINIVTELRAELDQVKDELVKMSAVKPQDNRRKLISIVILQLF